MLAAPQHRDGGSILGATFQAPCRRQTRADDKLRIRQGSKDRGPDKHRATDNEQKIRARRRLTKTLTGRVFGRPKRGGERSDKIGSAWRNTTRPRSST